MFFRRRVEEYVIKQGKKFILKSSAFAHGSRIPEKYTCDGDDVSPPLEWENPPDHTKAYALIMYDPDAPIGTFIHWVIYNIPANVNRLPEAIPKTEIVEGIGVQGINDFRNIGYGGPCPPPGHGEHRYFFALHALNAEIDLKPGATADQVIEAIKNHVIGYAILMGKYSR